MMVTAVVAQINPTSPFAAWDDRKKPQGGWRNSYIVMELPGVDGLEPFIAQLTFDNVQIPACAGGGTTQFAVTLELEHASIDNEDNDPDGAIGFGATSNWTAVRCSLMEDNQTPPQEAILGTCATTVADPNVYGFCEVVSKDVETPCNTSNGKTGLVTTVRGNLDQNCDGTIDNPDLPENDLSFHWTVEKPPADTTWKGTLQSRIASDGGDRTVSFTDNFIPTAINLVDFAASPSPVGPSMGMVILMPLGLLGLAAAALLWKRTGLG
jgi:hypothetical protein